MDMADPSGPFGELVFLLMIAAGIIGAVVFVLSRGAKAVGRAVKGKDRPETREERLQRLTRGVDDPNEYHRIVREERERYGDLKCCADEAVQQGRRLCRASMPFDFSQRELSAASHGICDQDCGKCRRYKSGDWRRYGFGDGPMYEEAVDMRGSLGNLVVEWEEPQSEQKSPVPSQPYRQPEPKNSRPPKSPAPGSSPRPASEDSKKVVHLTLPEFKKLYESWSPEEQAQVKLLGARFEGLAKEQPPKAPAPDHYPPMNAAEVAAFLEAHPELKPWLPQPQPEQQPASPNPDEKEAEGDGTGSKETRS